MICFPNAKINLGLNIVSKRNDGYHNLETIFYPIPVKDALEIIVKENQQEDSFVEAGLRVGSVPADNLAVKALKLMRTHYNFPSVEVHLLKKIPFGAGLGGGSADAAFMLRLLNNTFSLGASDSELAGLAFRLGADCPFFIYNRPVFASGIGDVFEDVSLSLRGYYFVLVKPDIHISTREAFADITPKELQLSLKEVIAKPVEEWKSLMVNDFEKSIFARHPQIREIKEELYSQGAIYASMSGSGSSVYAICKTDNINTETFGGSFVSKGVFE
ncbi:4-(cytidine 5'-diphospho)-2-C-methyl-D-erythritol kinase [Dysgonomonas sp. 511]|uniref:4-(cytidine 5'-diphospho)-2-C-methyl-D-erythritol kinase n=1 Tax=Dysgonomonas sp. 511 TaxID=2302930 RepID=UPI0013D80EBE|nr:4-(cytidine 5'-diphospho)-2-C-methyl-D-erythritol kinase [Dysgonomonas sp. 511]NDV78794.1 4-(cytidine 5'-diphospho)-2-C-methyl-D-erythritol kinase [Dysgonomonas sp. 511]